MKRNKLRVLVVDDNLTYLEAASRLLATYSFVEAVHVAHSLSEMFAMLDPSGRHFPLGQSTNELPDLILLDMALPDGNGINEARRIREALARAIGSAESDRSDLVEGAPKIVVVTLYDTPAYRLAAREAGTDGFLCKSELGESLQSVIYDLFPEVCFSSAR